MSQTPSSGFGTGMEIALLTGGIDRPYALGLAAALLSKGVVVDFVASDDLESRELRQSPGLTFLNLRGSQSADAPFASKISRVLLYYFRLIGYVWRARPRILHILWNNKFQTFDRTLLMLYYRLLGKQITFTAHNVNAAQRDASDSWLNRMTLGIQYRLSDHVFVHTDKMKAQLVGDFRVPENSVTVIPLGINNSVPNTALTAQEAKRHFGIKPEDRVILFFGNIGPYKGLEYLVRAFERVASENPTYRLIIAGKPKVGSESYFADVQSDISQSSSRDRVIQRIEFVPDTDTELYFKAADVVALPYTEVFQSGVLVLAYSFGLPVIATDVGSLRHEIVEGETGFVCKPRDSDDLANAIKAYFESGLFRALEQKRKTIRDYATHQYSWDAVTRQTLSVYERLLETSRG